MPCTLLQPALELIIIDIQFVYFQNSVIVKLHCYNQFILLYNLLSLRLSTIDLDARER